MGKISVVIVLLLFLPTIALAAKVYKIDATFFDKENIVRVNDVKVIDGESPDTTHKYGNYTAKLVGETNNLLSETGYAIVYADIVHYYTDVAPVARNEANLQLMLPFDETAAQLVFEREGKEITRFKLAQLQACNNNDTCDSFETIEACPNDCTPETPDDNCNDSIDGFCDPDCGLNVDWDCRQQAFENCGNGVCEQTESPQSCREDCSGKNDGVCDRIREGKCDPDCTEETDFDCRIDPCNKDGICQAGETAGNCASDCTQQPTSPPTNPLAPNPVSTNFLMMIGGILLAVLLITGFWYFYSKKKGDDQ